MSPPAITVIMEEHQALRAVLQSFRLHVEQARRNRTTPDFGALRALLFYADEVPAHWHHAKENKHLFPRVRERCPALRPVLDRLEAEHARGELAIRQLERALLAFEVMGESRREPFEKAAEGFVRQYLGHMEVEENYVIPVALGCLTEDDWKQLDQAFASSGDPVEQQVADEYRQLLRRVLFREGMPSSCK